MIIAVDGPSASGKGTIARALAEHFDLPHLDTGLLYRAVGYGVRAAGGDPESEADALAAVDFDLALLDNPDLRSEAVGALASRVSVIPSVRAALIQFQRDFAAQPAGAVLDGRDIGTVIAPDADTKLFVLASAARRAHRRAIEMQARGEPADFDTILAEIEERDRRDSTRTTAPLKPAADALLLDTSDLSIDAAVRRAIALVNGKIEGR